VAAQIVAGRNREVGVTLTPVAQGRFEIYLNGTQLYNRKELPSDAGFKDPTGDIRNSSAVAEMVRTKLLSALEESAAEPAAR